MYMQPSGSYGIITGVINCEYWGSITYKFLGCARVVKIFRARPIQLARVLLRRIVI